jgi:alpha-amylase/alpha-mannosidase (GH57 family)
MWKDKIVEEVRKNRERILENANFDMNKVIEDIKKLEASHKNKLITKPFYKDVVVVA